LQKQTQNKITSEMKEDRPTKQQKTQEETKHE